VTAALVVLAGGPAAGACYLTLAGRPVLAWSLRLAVEVDAFGPVVLVARPGDGAAATAAVTAADLDRPVRIVAGGDTRHASELAAFDALAGPVAAGEVDVVAVHDGTRPLAGADLAARVLLAARDHGGAVPVLPAAGVWRRDAYGTLAPPEPDGVPQEVQTPQAFRARPLLEAYERSRAAGFEGADTAATPEQFAPGLTVVAVRGHAANLAVTGEADLSRAAALLGGEAEPAGGAGEAGRTG
jgi:2-C-methyl-D-erythritol 4-phosphate cytidylyltransferase